MVVPVSASVVTSDACTTESLTRENEMCSALAVHNMVREVVFILHFVFVATGMFSISTSRTSPTSLLVSETL